MDLHYSGQPASVTYSLIFPFAETSQSDRIVTINDGVVVAPSIKQDAKEARGHFVQCMRYVMPYVGRLGPQRC